jgi:serine/threonine-protein kinase
MSKSREKLDPVPSDSEVPQIGSVCDRFEAALKQNAHPDIESYLEGWEEPERSKLLYELLLLEIEHRFGCGEIPRRSEYEKRFPVSQRVVEEVFCSAPAVSETVADTRADATLVISSQLDNLKYHDEGGLGVVYVAKDQKLKRDTAVKFIRDRFSSNPDSREQFLLEAEISSRLEHPGIVPVYGLGETEDGRLFYAMRFIQGETFEDAISCFHRQASNGRTGSRDGQMQFHELLGRFASVCQTIAYAHNRGIVHRDIKPENVLLGRYGETVLIDWGLAISVGREGVFKESGEKTLTPSSGSHSSDESGRGGGTPAYMSPEQAEGRTDVGPASDIYSLGVVLYKIATGVVPFRGQSAKQIRSRILRSDFKRPTQVNPGVSRALEAICLKAMAPDPKQRYSTAIELAEDVDRYMADVPVAVYKEPALRKLARWGRRHRTTAHSVLAALVLISVTGILGAVWEGRQARLLQRAYRHAEDARQSERALRERSLQVSAEFAARTIANQIDIRWRILEKEAANPELQ